MTVETLLQTLAGRQVSLWLEGDRLRYRAPQAALTPELLSQMKQHKSALVQRLSSQLAPYPLSHGQRALWFLSQLAPDSAAYNLAYAARLQPDVELAALERAVDALIKRHSSLRTTYSAVSGDPAQQAQPQINSVFETLDAFEWEAEALQKWLANWSDQPFDLEKGPIVRFTLLRQAPG